MTFNYKLFLIDGTLKTKTVMIEDTTLLKNRLKASTAIKISLCYFLRIFMLAFFIEYQLVPGDITNITTTTPVVLAI